MSEVQFRKGVGLVGTLLEQNQPQRLLVSDFERQEFVDALRGGDESWNAARGDITYRLDYEAAQSLAERYQEAVGTVIQDPRTGEAIGCVTLEVPRPWPVKLAEVPSVREHLSKLAAHLRGPLSIGINPILD